MIKPVIPSKSRIQYNSTIVMAESVIGTTHGKLYVELGLETP